MSETVTKQILIDVQLKADQLTKELPALAGNIARLTAYQKEQAKAGQQGTIQFQKNAQDLRELSAQYREANKYIDNSAKVRNAENNSIQQNRALLSLLTNDYVKLAQTQGKTSAATVSLGNQINNLTTKLKAQESQIGQTYRNVGNYTSSILQAIPGMSKYSTMLTNATRAFNLMGSASKQATPEIAAMGEAGEAAEGAIAIGAAAAAGAIAAVIAALVAEGAYLLQFQKYADGLSKTWAGTKAGAEGIMTSINGVGNEAKSTGNIFADLATKFALSYQEGYKAKGQIIDLSREAKNAATLTQSEDMQVQLILKQIRDRATTAAEAQTLYTKALGINAEQYSRNYEIAKSMFKSQVDADVAGYGLLGKQIDRLKDLSKGYKAVLDYAKQLVYQDGVSSDFLDKYNQTLQGIISVDNKKAQSDAMLKIREDMKQSRANGAADKEKALQDQIARATEQANSERIASITKMLEYEQEAFGKEISSTDEHYRQLIFKQQQFIEKQQLIANNKKHAPKTRELAAKAVNAGKADIDQLQQERYSESQRLLIEHNKLMIEIAARGALDLKALEIQNIDDGQKRELASINNQFEEKILTYKKNDAVYQENVRNLNKEITAKQDEIDKETDVKKKTILQNELQALRTTYNEQNELISQNGGIFQANEKAKQKAIDDTIKKYEDQKQAILNQIAVLDAGQKKGITGGNDNPFNSSLQSAKQKQLLDEYNAEVSNKRLTDEQKLLLEKQYLKNSEDLNKESERSKKDVILQGADIVKNAAFSIIENGIKSQAQAREVQLSKDKTNELANTSLTSSQKLAIENKYRVLQGQAKVKEFKAEQKASEAKIIISTAEAIAKASPNPLLIALAAATGAAEFAVAASQKPPAFAMGGTFKSDGKGAVLPGYSRKDNVNAQLRSGEAVIVSEAVQNPYARSILSAINTSFGGRSFSEINPGKGYAIGGIVTDGNNSNRYYAQPQEGTQNLANQVAYSLINNFPPVMVDVKDINNQQGILANTINRVKL